MNAALALLLTATLPLLAAASDATEPAVRLDDVVLTGDLTGGGAAFTLTARARVQPSKGGEFEVLSGPVALTGFDTHPRWRVRAEAGRFVLVFDRAGDYRVQLSFQARRGQTNGWQSVAFRAAPGPLRRLALRGLPAETQFQSDGATRPERSGAEFLTHLPVSGDVALVWKEAAVEAEGRLFFAAEALAQITVSPGLLRHSAALDCRVMQGELAQLELVVEGEGEVTRLQGAAVRSWTVRPGEGSTRRVTVIFNEPQKDQFALQLQVETPLGVFPQTVNAVRVRPEGATRFAAHVRVVNQGAVRLEVLGAEGLSQISPEQFPLTEAFKAVAPAPGPQVFVYRYAGGAWQLRLQADHILPEIGVSQVLNYHLGETESAVDAEVELDIREAPLRELTLRLPRGWAIARLNASGMNDYFVSEPEGSSDAQLRLVYGAPVSGRQVVQVRLERNAPPESPAWNLPRLEVDRAKSVRGHVGVSADAGFRLSPATTRGLTEMATAYFPRKTPGLQVCFRVSEPDWQASVAVERLAQSITADAFHLFSVAEGIAYGSSLVNYVIAGAPVSSLRLELSDDYLNPEFTGREIRAWRKVEGGYVVQLHTPVSGAYALLATYERPFKAQGETLSFAGIRPADAQSEQGHTVVISVFQFEVRPVNVSSNLLAVEPGEVPAEQRLFFDAPILAAYRYAARPFALQLELRPLAQGDTVNQVVDRAAFATRVSKEGQVLTTARYFVKSKGAPHLRVTLPPDQQLWSATVDGATVVPVADGPGHLVPLPRQPGADLVRVVELKMAGRSANPRHLSLAPPAVAAPVLLAEWTLEPEAGHALRCRRGSLTPLGAGADPSGFGMWQRWLRQRDRAESLVALGLSMALLLAALWVWKRTGRQGEVRHAVWHGLGLAGGLLAALAALVLLAQLSGELGRQRTTSPSGLHFLVPVQPAGATPTLEIENRSLERTAADWLGLLWPALAGLALAAVALVRGEGFGKRLGVGLAWALGVWAALRAPGGGPAALWLVAAFVVLHVLLPPLRTLLRLPRRPADSHPAPATAAAAAWMGAALLLGTGAGSADTNLPSPPRSTAQSILQTIRVDKDHALAEVKARWVARKGERLPLLLEPAVLTRLDAPRELFDLVERVEGTRRGVDLVARKAGTHEFTFAYQLRVGTRDGLTGFGSAVHPGLVNQVDLTLAGVDADVVVPQAVAVTVAPPATNATTARLTLPAVAEAWIGWKPRARDTRREKTVFYAELHQLFVPGSGVVEGLHQIHLRPAQGEIPELVVNVPAGATITDAAAADLASWRFDPDTRQLRLLFTKPHARPVIVQVKSQVLAGTLPYQQSVGWLTVSGAAGQLGLLGVATGNEVQLEDATGDGCSPINLEDFPRDAVQPLAARVAGLGVRRAFRHADRAGTLTVRATPVEADVRVEAQQTLSLGEDRAVLAANLQVEITRAGIFRLSFLLPSGLEVESITGPALSHWTELKTDAGRVVTLNLKGRTEGPQAFALGLAGPGLRSAKAWAVPRLALREASKQRGQLVIVPEQGMRLQVAARDGVTQLDPARSGIRQKGVLAFRLLQEPWQLTLDIEQVDSWIQVTSLQDVTVGDGLLKVNANLHYEIENTGIKILRVRLPAGAENVRFKGEQVADFLPRDPGTNATSAREWEVKLHRRMIGRYLLQASYHILTPGRPDTVSVEGLEALDANLQRGFVALRAEGRLQLKPETQGSTLQAAEWGTIPRLLMADLAPAAADQAFRLVEPAFKLPVRVERREAARLLPARVQAVALTSVISDEGAMLTRARVELAPGDKRLLHVRLPADARFWFAFVNQAPVWPWREGGQILLPLEPNARSGSATVVDFYYTAPVPAARGTTFDLAVTGPTFDLPLENITWRLCLNGRWELRDWSGTLELTRQEQVTPASGLDSEVYLRGENTRQQQQIKEAEQWLSLGNTFLEKGDPKQARRAFQNAYGLSQSDNAFNEDARVQLHNLKMQQALIGLNARQAVAAGDTAAPAARWREQTGERGIAYTQDEARKILEGQPAEENAVQMRLVERLVQQQDVALPSPAALRANLPEQGRLVTFTRSLLVDPWAGLELRLEARARPPVSRSAQAAVLGGLIAAMMLLGWAARRAARPAQA